MKEDNDMRGMPGYMRGVNLGGWLSQCDDTSKQHYDSFITEDDIIRIAGMGLDHVRVPVDYILIETEDGEVIEDGYKYIDNCIEWCIRHGLHVIIDLHQAYGYSFSPLDKSDKTRFFRDKDLQQRFFDLWSVISGRYSRYSDNVAFELLNEIVMYEVKDQWNDIALQAVEVIRKNAPDSWIIFGGVFYNSVTAVQWLPLTADRKVAYTFHYYEPMIFTHQGAHWLDFMPLDFRTGYPKSLEEYRKEASFMPREMAGAIYDEGVRPIGPGFIEGLIEPAIKVARERDIPLYCGEYGVIDKADRTDMIRWLDDVHSIFEKYQIGRALWNYKEKDYGIAGDDMLPYINEISSRL